MPADDGSGLKRRLVRVALPPHEEFYAPTFHPDCAANQVRAVVGRVIGVVPKPSKEGISRLHETCKLWGRTLYKTAQAPLEDMVNRYHGAKKARYERALERVHSTGVNHRDAYINAFVKPERFDASAKVDPDPRAIQFRGSKYCVELASYLQPGEHQLYRTKFGSKGVPPTRNVAKGLNQRDRAMLLKQKLSHFEDPVVISLDASRFDKHVSKDLLRVEHRLYSFFNSSRRFAWLLSLQLVNKCFTKLGMKYIADGRRMSGDMNTALGNCVLMILMLVTYLLHIAIDKFDILDDGDDCLLIVEGADYPRVADTVHSEFLHYGMEMKVDGVARRMEEVVFCRSKPIEITHGNWTFVRDYRDVVSKALTGIRHWYDPKYRRRVIKAIGTCELSLNYSVPVLQAFACALLRNTSDVAFDEKYLSDGLKARWRRESLRSQPGPITLEAREQFSTAFGCSVHRQLELEEYFHNWTYSEGDIVEWGVEWDSDWIPFQSLVERGGQNATQH